MQGSPILPRLFAVLLPAALLAVAAVHSGVLTPVDDALPALSVVNRAGQAFLLRPDTTVVVVGNSQAFSAVDPTALGTALGRPKQVGLATAPGVMASTAYAILKYRVFGAGIKPELVVLPMALHQLLDVNIPAGPNLTRLQAHLPGSDPAIDEKVFGRSASALPKGAAAALGRVQEERDALLQELTSLPLRAARFEDPAARMDQARDAVLGEVAGSNLALQVRVMANGDAAPPKPAAATLSLEQTLLPDLVALCREHGAQLVIATVPQKQSLLAATPQTTRRVAYWLRGHGVPLLDLEGLETPAEAWLDPGHLSPTGQRLFTAALAQGLHALGALSGEALQMPPLPLKAPRITRSGAIPPPVALRELRSPDGCLLKMKLEGAKHRSDSELAALGLSFASPLTASVDGVPVVPHVGVSAKTGCTNQMSHEADMAILALPYAGAQVDLGWAEAPSSRRIVDRADLPLIEDVLWAPPGTALALGWEEPVPATAVTVLALALTPGAAPPSLRVDGQDEALQPWGNLWLARAEVPTGALRDPIELVVPPDGPELIVRLVMVEDASGRHIVHGHPSETGWALPLAGIPTVDVKPALPADVVASGGVRDGDTLTFSADGPVAALTFDALRTRVADRRFVACMPLGARHSPDGVYRDGVVQLEAGKLLLRGLQPGDDAWEIVWRSRRTCVKRSWVLPGETVTFTTRLPRGVFVPTDLLYLDVAAFPATGLATVAVIAGDTELLRSQVDLAGPRPILLPLATSAPASPAAVRMEVTAPAEAFLSVGLAELRPASAPDAAWFTREPSEMKKL